MSRPIVGIVGGGQLARMTAQSAVSLAVDVHVLVEHEDDPAASAATSVVVGDHRDPATLERFSRPCDVLTFDHGRVDPFAVAALEGRGRCVRPSSLVLRCADKAFQRRTFDAIGIPLPPFGIVHSAAEIGRFAADHGWPVVAKTPIGGWDGDGVFVLSGPDEARALFERLGGVRLVVEPLLELLGEFVVLVARRPGGEAVAYPVVDTVDDGGICVETAVPSVAHPAHIAAARALALRLAHEVGATGILAVEFLVTPQGVLVDELVPRPHRSGHWTIEGAVTSQFENHLRGVLDWPLGDTGLRALSHAGPAGPVR